MKKVHFIPSDDIQTNHTIHVCTCRPVVKKEQSYEDGPFIGIYHRYTDNKGYIKEVCRELGVSTPKFSYIQISQDAVT